MLNAFPSETDPHASSNATRDDAEAVDNYRIALAGDQRDTLSEPLVFLHKGLQRERIASAMLMKLTTVKDSANDAALLYDYFINGFNGLRRDFRQAFYPLLREYCLPDDSIDRLLARIERDMPSQSALNEKASKVILSISKGYAPNRSEKKLLASFARELQRHVAISNAAIFPIARLRLDDAAREQLSAQLRAIRAASGETSEQNGECS